MGRDPLIPVNIILYYSIISYHAYRESQNLAVRNISIRTEKETGLFCDLAGPLVVKPNELLIHANVTPEFPWKRVIAEPIDATQQITLTVNAEEAAKLQVYLNFLRYEQWSDRKAIP